jgi:hypothetical protein
MAARRLLWLAAALPLLCACGDTSPPPRREAEVKRSDEQPKWLSPIDRHDPAAWLAEHETKGASDDQAAVERMRDALAEAGPRFLESDRMLANRTAQIGDMLAEAGMKEDLAELLAGLSRVADVATSKQTFGELCQHYYNLRRQGREREAALAELVESYRLQSREK